VPPCATLWHEAKKDSKPILPAQRLHKSSTHPAQPAFLPGALFIPAVSHPSDNKAARRAALWLSLEPYFGFTTKSKPCLPLKNRPLLHKTAALRIKQASTYAEKPGHFPQYFRPATKQRTPTYFDKPDCFRQNRRLAIKTNPTLHRKTGPFPAQPPPCR
jgi:hypothetical protein